MRRDGEGEGMFIELRDKADISGGRAEGDSDIDAKDEDDPLLGPSTTPEPRLDCFRVGGVVVVPVFIDDDEISSSANDVEEDP